MIRSKYDDYTTEIVTLDPKCKYELRIGFTNDGLAYLDRVAVFRDNKCVLPVLLDCLIRDLVDYEVVVDEEEAYEYVNKLKNKHSWYRGV